VVARADGTIIRLLTSPYIISMFAWSPVGHRLGWTTSGFPDPHQLFVLDGPRAEPRKVYVGGGHFDWITWSPDGNRILLDREDGLNLWLVLDPDRQERPVALPRLGGAPLWCCPPNAFASGVS
jgi:Tol biopolymer transport system component